MRHETALVTEEARLQAEESLRSSLASEIEAKQVVEHAEQGIRREGELAEQRVLRKIAEAAVEKAFDDIGAEIDDATRRRVNAELVEGLVS